LAELDGATQQTTIVAQTDVEFARVM
jgi:hypothetical protein